MIVGVGQHVQHEDDPAAASEPVDLLAEAARHALEDSHAAAGLGTRVDTVGVVEIVSWRYPDPGAALARRLGLAPRSTVLTTAGGNSPQMLVTELCERIAGGTADVVLLGGAEALRTRFRARRPPKTWLEWSREDDQPCAEVIGTDRPGSTPFEEERGLDRPLHVYPLFETARRHAHDLGVAEHRDEISKLWAHLSERSASNPHAWAPRAYSPKEIRDPDRENRMVVFPYTKRMCANESVDMAAALVLCSYEAATTAGVPEDRLVFPLAGADGHDHWEITQRWSLAAAPGLGVTARAALAAAGQGVDDVARFDLYSCFPSAVGCALDQLGLAGPDAGDERPLTVTGGLAFAGGPASNYVSHSIAAMVQACREDPGSVGMVTAIGWYLTKHAAGFYSTRPPEAGFRRADPEAIRRELASLPSRRAAVDDPLPDDAQIEATAVIMGRDGRPEIGLVAALTADGGRGYVRVPGPDVCRGLMEETWEGRALGHLMRS